MGDQHVDTHVPFRASDQMRIRDVFLYHTLLVVLQIRDVIYEGDLAASAEISGFTYPDFSF